MLSLRVQVATSSPVGISQQGTILVVVLVLLLVILVMSAVVVVVVFVVVLWVYLYRRQGSADSKHSAVKMIKLKEIPDN